MYKISSRWFLHHHSGRFAMTPGQKHRKYTINCPQLVFIGYHKVMYPVELADYLAFPTYTPCAPHTLLSFYGPGNIDDTPCVLGVLFLTVSMPFNSILVFNGFWNFFCNNLR